MDSTHTESLPTPEQNESGATGNIIKRAASPSSSDTSNKRPTLALTAKDTCNTGDETSTLPAADIPCEELRGSLDEDERFLELPQLFDLVGVMAEKYGLDDELLHRNYRGQDAVSCLQNRTCKWNISMSRARSFQPVTIVANSVHVLDGKEYKQETILLGREQEEGPQLLTISPEIPKCPPIRMRTGKSVNVSRDRMKRLTRARPGLARSLDDCLVTETSLSFNRVDAGHTDLEDRVDRAVIVGDIAHAELDRSEGLVLYSEYGRKDITGEYARENNLCRLLSLAMILCHELGNFWAYRLQFPDISIPTCWYYKHCAHLRAYRPLRSF
ncbi:hypothetical protein MBLNU13_g07582t1 [Cladosporium sp. NU13]